MTGAQVSPPDLSTVSGPCPSRSGGFVNEPLGTASSYHQAVPGVWAATPSPLAALAPGTRLLPPGLEIYAAASAEHDHGMARDMPSSPRDHGMSMPGMHQPMPHHARPACFSFLLAIIDRQHAGRPLLSD